jgi:NIMA (never in mitosis gene a)-related kinase
MRIPDLKPGNLFLMQDGCMKLGDLGLSRYFSSKTHEVFSMVGTPYYLSPEAIANEGYDFASDIWSLGCIIYELCELQSPFYAPQSNLYLLGKKIRSAEYQPLTNYSDALCRLVSQMIVVASADRPSAAQVLEYCQQALAHFTSQAAQEEAAMMLADDEYADEFVTDAEADQLSASLQLPLGNQYAPAKDRFFRSI